MECLAQITGGRTSDNQSSLNEQLNAFLTKNNQTFFWNWPLQWHCFRLSDRLSAIHRSIVMSAPSHVGKETKMTAFLFCNLLDPCMWLENPLSGITLHKLVQCGNRYQGIHGSISPIGKNLRKEKRKGLGWGTEVSKDKTVVCLLRSIPFSKTTSFKISCFSQVLDMLSTYSKCASCPTRIHFWTMYTLTKL